MAFLVGALMAGAVFPVAGLAAEAGGHFSSPTGGSEGLQSPYAGRPESQATGLLPEEAEGLAKGAGMAMALPAELNDHPGPRHVLDASDAGQISLRPEQREAVQRLFDRMSAEAKAKGQEILQAEAHLAMRFRHAHIGEASLREILERIGKLRTDLRFIHLRTHLETKSLLTPEQLTRYNAVRGYDGSGGSSPQHKH